MYFWVMIQGLSLRLPPRILRHDWSVKHWCECRSICHNCQIFPLDWPKFWLEISNSL